HAFAQRYTVRTRYGCALREAALHVLTQCFAADHWVHQNPVAHRHRGDIRTDTDHITGDITPGDMRQWQMLTGHPLPYEDVQVVQSAGPHPDQHLIHAVLRYRMLAHDAPLGPATGDDQRCTHRLACGAVHRWCPSTFCSGNAASPAMRSSGPVRCPVMLGATFSCHAVRDVCRALNVARSPRCGAK